MENLQLQFAYSLEIPRDAPDELDDPVVHFCLDSTDEGVLYALTQSGQVLCLEQYGKKLLWSTQLPISAEALLQDKLQDRSQHTTSAHDPSKPPPPGGFVDFPAFCFVVELDALFIACSSGELLLLDAAQHSVEEVGVVQGGVAAAAWSPNGELLAVLGCNGLLLIMNKEWDVLAEVPVPPPQQQQQQQQQPVLLSATLTWRGDSNYLATNTLWSSSSSYGSGNDGSSNGSSSSRVLHIWDREGCQLHATAQQAPGLAAAIAWQPNSRHLYAAAAVPPSPAAAADGQKQLRVAPHQRVAAAGKTAPAAATAAAGSNAKQQQQQPDATWLQHIVLYERNGLQHGGFDVPTYSTGSSDGSSDGSDGPVIHSLHWSSDSKLLAVVLAPPAAAAVKQQQRGEGEGQDTLGCTPHEWRLQLWHRSNWHWYLKHEQRHELPDVSGVLMVCWDDAQAGRLHLLSGAGCYSRLDFGWCVSLSGRGTAAVIDGHQLLITPLRHGLVPPPMCAVRALLPRPAVALAWCDGDMSGDLDGQPDINNNNTNTQSDSPAASSSSAPAAAAAAAAASGAAGGPNGADSSSGGSSSGEGFVDVLARGLCEVLAVLLSDGEVVFLRAVESDLWEETLEDQTALGGPRDVLLPLGYCTAATAASSSAADAAATAANDAEYYGGMSMPSGPWSSTASGGGVMNGSSSYGGDVQRQQWLPLNPADSAAAAVPKIPLAEGRTVMGLVWLGQQHLLLLAAPLDETSGIEEGEGTVLVEVSVQLPAGLYAGSSSGSNSKQQQQQVETAAVRTSYAGGRVLAAAAHPAGGAVLQLSDGRCMYYPCSSSGSSGSNGGGWQQQQALLPLPAAASFPSGCAIMLVLPHAPAPTAAGSTAAAAAAAGSSSSSSSSSTALQQAVRVAAAAPVVGLSPAGVLYWGSKSVASDVVSVCVRGGGPGGPALLYITRQSLLYVVMVGQLPRYRHVLPDESTGVLTWKRSEYPGDLRAAMSAAMRPAAAAAAARDPHMRAVEQGSSLLCCPYGCVDVVLSLPRGNLEGIAPRLLVLSAVCDALDRGDYGAAWGLAVNNRVDLNLLVDYCWPSFLSHAPALVSAVPDPSDLADIILALQHTNTLTQGGTYAALADMLGWQTPTQPLAAAAPAAAAAGSDGGSSGGGSKVSAVCAALRSAVLQLPGRFIKGHLKTVVMSFARSDPPSLEGALLAIREVKEAAVAADMHTPQQQQQQPATTAATAAAAPFSVTPEEAAHPAELSAAADAALKHLLLYVDVDQLYHAALGLYDLPLAFMVVSHSQKDPGEYLSELGRFGAQENEHLRRHAIDLSLGRYNKALENLVAAGPGKFDAALKLAKDRGLLRQLLALTQQEQQQQQYGGLAAAAAAGGSSSGSSSSSSGVLSVGERLVAVLSAYGDALLSARKAEDAAVAYSAAGLFEEALGAYRSAGAWRMALVLGARLQLPPQQQQELARDLADQLLASGAAADAAVLLLQHLGDTDGGVAALVTAKEWREALRVAYAADRGDLVDTVVVPEAAQAASSLLSDANEAIDRITKYSARLTEVRQRRVAMAAALAAAEAAAAAAGPEDDLVSEAPSMISGFSIYTDATGAVSGAAGFSGSGSSAASSRAASTIGGRKPMRNEKRAAKKAQKKGGKIKAGSPGEESALEAHLLSLGPAKHVLEEAGQLTELLVMLQHTADAAKLQQRVGQWQAAAAAAAELVAQGQQQQQTQAAAGAGATTAAGNQPPAAAAVAAASEVRWKWDVLREQK